MNKARGLCVVGLLVGLVVFPAVRGMEANAADRAFHDLPAIGTEILGQGASRHVLTTRVTIELAPATERPSKTWVTAATHALRERLSRYRIVDIQGSAGMYRLRDDLLRVAQDVDPTVRVKDILFRDLRVE